jgi:hypothetical protein
MSDQDRMDQPEPDDTYGLVMPFVTVASKGGPHDDRAYVAGWQCGTLDVELRIASQVGVTQLDRTVSEESLPQLDLIAMKHGFQLVRHDWSEEDAESGAAAGWASVSFALPAHSEGGE